MKKNLVIFDGSNFYHGAKRLAPRVHLTDFNYKKLAETIAKSKNLNIEYCVGEIRQERHRTKSIRLYANQQALFYNLEKQGINVKKGYMLKHFTYHEKGVDVQIAIDILTGALKNEYSKCYIISSDTDILPAILEARTVGKKVIYVGFENSVSRAMKANCNSTFLISKKLIKDCSN
jgi:uncharacterized LabA/DUF88 family protein